MKKVASSEQSLLRITLPLAGIFGFRMLGLFMIFPIFSLYTTAIPQATPRLMGIALGIYGLTQALLQIPLGMLSDRIGRKPVIFAGLIIFIIGSIVAGSSHTIYFIILGRALQGAGAIGSTILALLADLTKAEQRSKAMGIIGIAIGFSFMLAMLLGPLLNASIQLSGIFWLTAGLGIIGIILLFGAVPTPTRLTLHRDTEPLPKLFKACLSNPQLVRLYLSIMLLHGMLTALFLALPIALTKAGLSETHQWYVYLPTLIIAFIAMMPLIMAAEKRGQMKAVLLLNIALLLLTQIILFFTHSSLIFVAITLLFFFVGFTVLEAILPSLVSKLAPAGSKGTAIGIFSACQFLGIFLGGSLGGWIFGRFQINGIFLFAGLIALIWFLFFLSMPKPPQASTLLLSIPDLNKAQATTLCHLLTQQSGVIEANIATDEGVAYLKVNKKQIERSALENIIKKENFTKNSQENFPA